MYNFINVERPPFFVAIPPGTFIRLADESFYKPGQSIEISGYILEFENDGPYYTPFYFESGGMMYLPDHKFKVIATNPYTLPGALQYE